MAGQFGQSREKTKKRAQKPTSPAGLRRRFDELCARATGQRVAGWEEKRGGKGEELLD